MSVERTGLKAGGLLWVPDGLLLVKRIGSRDGLVIPKGGPKPGDPNLAATAEREIYEETGHRARVARFLDVVTRGSIDVDSPESYKEIHVFLTGEGVRDEHAVPEELTECIPDPATANFMQMMRYPEEAQLIVRHLPAILRLRS